MSGTRVPPAGFEPTGEAVPGGHTQGVPTPDDPSHQHQGGGPHHHTDSRWSLICVGHHWQVRSDLIFSMCSEMHCYIYLFSFYVFVVYIVYVVVLFLCWSKI